MKYLKISLFILFFSIIILSSANSKVKYVEEGSKQDTKSKLLTDKVVYKIYNEYEVNPIYCLAIFRLALVYPAYYIAVTQHNTTNKTHN